MDLLPPKKESGQTKRRILETSIDLFSQNGFTAVSVREITKQVGIKESALYNHFKTKDDILKAIYEVFTNRSEGNGFPAPEQLRAMLENTELDTFLKQGFEQYKRTVENPLLVKIWRILNMEQYRDVRARDIILTCMYKGTIDFLELAFSILQEQGKIKKEEHPAVLAVEYQYPIFAMMTEYLLLTHNHAGTDELEIKVAKHIEYFSKHVKN